MLYLQKLTDVLKNQKRHGSSPNCGSIGSWLPIHGAVFHNHEAILMLLLKQNDIDVNASCSALKGYAPIHLTLARPKVFEAAFSALLARSDIDLTKQSMTGQTPLHIAALVSNIFLFCFF